MQTSFAPGEKLVLEVHWWKVMLRSATAQGPRRILGPLCLWGPERRIYRWYIGWLILTDLSKESSTGRKISRFSNVPCCHEQLSGSRVSSGRLPVHRKTSSSSKGRLQKMSIATEDPDGFDEIFVVAGSLMACQAKLVAAFLIVVSSWHRWAAHMSNNLQSLQRGLRLRSCLRQPVQHLQCG